MSKWKLVGFAACMSVAACAHDSYTVVPGGPGSPDKLAADTKDCKLATIHQYYDGRSAFGVIGVALSGGDPDNKMKPSDMKAVTEQCMRDKGYLANSDNSP